MEDDLEYTTLVYEFIDAGENEPSAIEKVADFIYHVGFLFSSSSLAKKKRMNSFLIDYADIVYPDGYGWHDFSFGMRDAKRYIVGMGNHLSHGSCISGSASKCIGMRFPSDSCRILVPLPRLLLITCIHPALLFTSR